MIMQKTLDGIYDELVKEEMAGQKQERLDRFAAYAFHALALKAPRKKTPESARDIITSAWNLAAMMEEERQKRYGADAIGLLSSHLRDEQDGRSAKGETEQEAWNIGFGK